MNPAIEPIPPEIVTLQAENHQLKAQVAQLRQFEQERQQLLEQVTRLVKAERSMIEFQDKLDLQINFYRQLNEIAKRLKTTFVPEEILAMALEFMLYDLNFERCLILRADLSHPQLATHFHTFLADGYEEAAPIDLTLVTTDYPDLALLHDHDWLVSPLDAPTLPELGQHLGLDEFILCAIRSQPTAPQYLIALGNTADRAKLFSRVTAQADYLVVLSNLLAQISGAIGQARLYQATHDQAETLKTTIAKLQSTQSQLIQTEKMSSLGQLVAGIAHEINNPVNFIHGNLTYVKTYANDLLKLIDAYQTAYPAPDQPIQSTLDSIDFGFLQRDFPQVIASMQIGTSRIQEIVLSLRNFSRMDESECNSVNLHDGIDSTLLILQHRLKASHERPAIQLTKQYADLPPIECAAGLINQVFMNLLSNAIDAMESACQQQLIQQPEITIATTIVDDGIQVSIIDNGTGIPETIQHRLFNPFFTTKPVGKGTGLGLSISYQIITEKHHGKLSCHSILGQGTEFRIWLPLRSGS
jgi:signal transduction histidine kinase